MAGETAGLRIQRRRVEHIHQLMGEIADRQRIVAHLMTVTFRAGYYFLTLACLAAGLIGLVQGRHSLAVTWGSAGVLLVLLWGGTKIAESVSTRVVGKLREEMAKGRAGETADTASGGDAESAGHPPVSP